MRDDEISIKMKHLYKCPDETKILKTLKKKVDRINASRNKKYVVPLCNLLVLSQEFAINPAFLDSIPDTTVKRCWECMFLLSHNIPEHISEWLVEAMADRSQVSYTALFCQSNPTLATLPTIQDFPMGLSTQSRTNIEIGFSDILWLWHRDDVVSNTLIAHRR